MEIWRAHLVLYPRVRDMDRILAHEIVQLRSDCVLQSIRCGVPPANTTNAHSACTETRIPCLHVVRVDIRTFGRDMDEVGRPEADDDAPLRSDLRDISLDVG